jgi:hypothetical protein
MSSGSEELISVRKKVFYIQNLLENHNIGRKLAEKSLGIVQNFLYLIIFRNLILMGGTVFY